MPTKLNLSQVAGIPAVKTDMASVGGDFCSYIYGSPGGPNSDFVFIFHFSIFVFHFLIFTSPFSFSVEISIFIFYLSVFVFNVLISPFSFSVENSVFIFYF